ncbi:hypothetical protein N7462_006132 [Penicillium macrosclerotiorum]|uniref:uncharacterized protein n=1 Tax=Penicillium macrosclerotiorum TaxID=303699 RepID=UPI002548A69E|nr:uncharacterized protein N7462_006132 [Penicillium macrosclerotiorum]KAJ5682967.1 hypothetical protein N7462_006132 [Penicillium macrosclerotiorum]
MGWWEILSEPDNSEKEAFDVVLVHGLCRNAKATWESIDPFHYGYAKWFSERVSQSRVLQYNYHPLDNDSNTLCLNGIRREALKLLDALRSLPSGKGNRGPLVFIGHDIGAIIIKEVGNTAL